MKPLERWIEGLGEHDTNKKVDEFLLDVISVCNKHKMSLGMKMAAAVSLLEGVMNSRMNGLWEPMIIQQRRRTKNACTNTRIHPSNVPTANCVA